MPSAAPERERVLEAVRATRTGPGIATPSTRSRPSASTARCAVTRRVDAAREPDHRAGRQVLLAEVVADAEHERAPRAARRGSGSARDRAAASRARTTSRAGSKCGSAARTRPCASTANERAVEDQLVVPADLVAEQRSARRGAAPAPTPSRVAPRPCPTWKGDADTFTTSPAPARASSPVGIELVAHHARSRRPRRRVRPSAGRPPPAGTGAALRGRHEVAVLVEHVVGREQRLRLRRRAARRRAAAPRSSRAASRRAARRGSTAPSTIAMPCDAGAERVELAQLVAHEAVALEQVHRRVAGERQLGKHHEPRPGGLGLARRLLDQRAVAREVADDRGSAGRARRASGPTGSRRRGSRRRPRACLALDLDGAAVRGARRAALELAHGTSASPACARASRRAPASAAARARCPGSPSGARPSPRRTAGAACGARESVRCPWAMVVPKGDSRCARSGSTWIHWSSPVASAKASMRGLVDEHPVRGLELVAHEVLQSRDVGNHRPGHGVGAAPRAGEPG